ncbi:efflux RND transporter periplasmic adaptor subunit [Microcoleus sp. LEGE 07076]|uniref:efflux RND transporter periplasmic adaptor subunit n=1 Tax=Microcoleus sp. LEGE 07076 TaxID=915322 RepID=UPI00187EFFD6|nr:efflux RND transporter periplasmic adaptor subunit [Microcoleus sp. LEGE 07076]MBE9186108.1 efflux RND transporter periplasmic adaptor subunit [Microcoleus sp. LEGE 07076]
MSYSKSPESVVEEPKQKSTAPPELQPTDGDSDRAADFPAVAEIPRPAKPRSRWLLIAALAIVTGGGFGWYLWRSSHNPPAQQAAAGQPKGIPVKIATVESSSVQDTSEFVSSLEAKRSVAIKPQVEGLVTEIFVKSGDSIDKGQAIARMKNDSAQADLRQSQANLIRAESRYAELQAGSRPEEIAQAQAQVAQAIANLAQLRSGSRPEEIGQAQARVSQAEADLADAQTGSLLEDIAQAKAQIEANTAEAKLASQQLARYQVLAKEGAASANTLQEYIQKESTAKANLREAQRRLEQRQKNRQAEIDRRTAALQQQQQALRQSQNGSRPEEIAKAEAEVAQAKAKLAELANGTRPEQLDQARAQVAEAAAQVRGFEVQLQETAVIAPFAGVIGDIPVKVGDYLNKGDAIATLTENQLLDLRLSIPLQRMSQLRLGLPVEMLDDRENAIAKGQISFISPNVSANSQTILAKATFPNPGGELLNLQFVKARVIWDQKPGILVPVTAVTRLGGQTFVFTAQKPEQPKPGMPPLIARQKPVKLGTIDGNNYQVTEGLKAGEKVIVAGILNLTDGVPVMAQEEGKKAGEKLPLESKK